MATFERHAQTTGKGELPSPKVTSFEEVRSSLCGSALHCVKGGIFSRTAKEISDLSRRPTHNPKTDKGESGAARYVE